MNQECVNVKLYNMLNSHVLWGYICAEKIIPPKRNFLLYVNTTFSDGASSPFHAGGAAVTGHSQ